MNIGAYEAKTHLPALLERVARGEQFTITNYGRPIAYLVPIEEPAPIGGAKQSSGSSGSATAKL